MIHPIIQAQAVSLSDQELIWRARLRSGEVIWEQPGVSSDHLPVEQVVGIDYVPCARKELPTIETHIDLGRDERFVRYWTTLWTPKGRGTQRLYVAGVERRGRHALLCYYPAFNKVTFAAQRPFQPFWTPEPFRQLPSAAIIVGGPGTPQCGWHHEGFGGLAVALPDNRLSFRAIYG